MSHSNSYCQQPVPWYDDYRQHAPSYAVRQPVASATRRALERQDPYAGSYNLSHGRQISSYQSSSEASRASEHPPSQIQSASSSSSSQSSSRNQVGHHCFPPNANVTSNRRRRTVQHNCVQKTENDIQGSYDAAVKTESYHAKLVKSCEGAMKREYRDALGPRYLDQGDLLAQQKAYRDKITAQQFAANKPEPVTVRRGEALVEVDRCPYESRYEATRALMDVAIAEQKYYEIRGRGNEYSHDNPDPYIEEDQQPYRPGGRGKYAHPGCSQAVFEKKYKDLRRRRDRCERQPRAEHMEDVVMVTIPGANRTPDMHKVDISKLPSRRQTECKVSCCSRHAASVRQIAKIKTGVSRRMRRVLSAF